MTSSSLRSGLGQSFDETGLLVDQYLGAVARSEQQHSLEWSVEVEHSIEECERLRPRWLSAARDRSDPPGR